MAALQPLPWARQMLQVTHTLSDQGFFEMRALDGDWRTSASSLASSPKDQQSRCSCSRAYVSPAKLIATPGSRSATELERRWPCRNVECFECQLGLRMQTCCFASLQVLHVLNRVGIPSERCRHDLYYGYNLNIGRRQSQYLPNCVVYHT